MNIADKIAMALSIAVSANYGTKYWCEELWGITEEDLKEFLEFGRATMTGYREGVEKCKD